MSEPLFSDPTPDPLTSALHKLKWARDGEWSVPLSPGECGAVLDALDPNAKLLNIGDRVTVRLQGRTYECIVDVVDFTTGVVTLQAESVSPRYVTPGYGGGGMGRSVDIAGVVVSSSQTGVDATRPTTERN